MAFWQWSKVSGNNGNIDASINMSEGMPPAQLNDGGRAIMARMAEYRDDVSGLLLTAGTSIAYTVTTNQGLAATPNDGQLLVVSLHVLNGAAATLSVDGGAAFPLQFNPGNAVAAGTLPANVPFPVKFRAASSSWILLGAGVASIADSVLAGSVTNAALANMAASTLKGNPTLSSAVPTDFTIDSLTSKSPVAADEILIWDVGSSQMKKVTFGALPNSFAAPTVQSFTSGSGTYIPTVGVIRIRGRISAGGGGGGGGSSGNGGNGGNTTFGGWGAVAGGGGTAAGGAGGTGGSGGGTGTGTLITRFKGGDGGGGGGEGGQNGWAGAQGGSNPFGGGGGGGFGTNGSAGAGKTASANTGGGGGGGGGTGVNSGGGGGAGEYVEFWMTAAQVGASQAYSVGAAGSAGSGSSNGGAGALGFIVVEEFYI